MSESQVAFSEASLKRIRSAIDQVSQKNPFFQMELSSSFLCAGFGYGERITISFMDGTYQAQMRGERSVWCEKLENEQDAVNRFIGICKYKKSEKVEEP